MNLHYFLDIFFLLRIILSKSPTPLVPSNHVLVKVGLQWSETTASLIWVAWPTNKVTWVLVPGGLRAKLCWYQVVLVVSSLGWSKIIVTYTFTELFEKC